MFSSLASFLFGSNTSATTTCELNKNSELEKKRKLYPTGDNRLNGNSEKDTLTETNVPTSLISEGQQAIATRSKNKRCHRKNKNNWPLATAAKRPIIAEPAESIEPRSPQSSDGDLDSDENGWFFVEREEITTSKSIFQTSSEEKLSLIRDNIQISTPTSKPLTGSQSELPILPQKLEKPGSRQYQHGNYQKPNQNTNAPLVNSCCGTKSTKTLYDKGFAQSLNATPGYNDSGRNVSAACCESRVFGSKLFTMEDSWYLTPPPCFTSNVHIQLVISPFENLLIEHPSMSVYHSITSAQNATESFANFALKEIRSNQIKVQPLNVKMPKNHQRNNKENENLQYPASPGLVVSPTTGPAAVLDQDTQVVAEERAPVPRIDRCSAAQLKMELFAWNSQKCMVKRDRQHLRRSAILRANQVREIKGRGNRQRRSDQQHCRLVSGVNNNRKCC